MKIWRLLALGTVVVLLGLLLLGCSGGSINSPLPSIKDQGTTATGLQGEKRGTPVGGTPAVPETEG
ncbi:MAG: hypothetical protein RMK89_07250 [Armatimonadota bacterium]|nr:hypothetical protein [Armatimonadota bacterium]MDW8143241.1 hypothetical protein [Armatimonadota bacterium]